LQALHTFIAMMMFMSLALSSLLSMMRRQGVVEAGGGGGGGNRSSMMSSRRGLSREVIDSLPLKRYKAPSPSAAADDGDNREETSHLENDAECCPICLVDFSDGREVRTLPCGHDFDRECIDSWLLDHTTCPTCRENIENIPLVREEATIAAASNVFLTQPEFVYHWPFVRSRWSGIPSTDAGLRVDNEGLSNNDRESTRPRLVGIRGFLGRRGGRVGSTIPVDEDELRRESVELVLIV
jgi:hypothetical protein